MVLEPSSIFGRTFLKAIIRSVMWLSGQYTNCSATSDHLLSQHRGKVGSSLWLDVSASLLKKKK